MFDEGWVPIIDGEASGEGTACVLGGQGGKQQEMFSQEIVEVTPTVEDSGEAD